MDTSETYIKMCDCPEIQDLWEPAIGDYMLRKYTVFGEPLDSQVWPDKDQQEEISILHYHSSMEQYWNAVTPDGDTQIVSFPDSGKMVKVTSIWLPCQNQLQELLPYADRLQSLTLAIHTFSESQYGSGFTIGGSMEQLWLAFVMKELHNKKWVGDKWVSYEPMRQTIMPSM